MAGQTVILHVDDDPSFGDLTKTFLEREIDRFTVETVTSADAGLRHIADEPPDCVVSDYNMPEMDGIVFLRAVREEYPDLPFILFTGKGSEAVASEAIEAGVTDYIQKGSVSEQYELLANRIGNAVASRREAERADRQEELMRLTERVGDTGGFEVNTETGEMTLTDGARRILNLPEDATFTAEDTLAMADPEDREEIRRTMTQAVETGEQTHGAWPITPPDGEQRVLEVTYTPRTSDEDDATLRGALRDITDRRERQRELRLLQQSIDNANAPITLADPSEEDNPLVYVNDGFEEMTGYPPDEALGRNCRFLQGEDTDPEKVAALRDAIDNEEPITVELCNYRKDGAEFWNRLAVAPIYDDDGQLVRYLGTQEDVTERKERERELRAERRFIEQALDTLDDLFYVLNTDGTFRRWNSRLPEVTGHADQDLAGMQAIELFPEDERETIADGIEATLADGRVTVEADMLTADGERRPYEFTGAQLTDEDGDVTGLVGIGRDLTQRRRHEQRFRTLVEESNDVITILDADGTYQYQSPSIRRVLGYDPEETVGEPAWDYVHPDDRARIKATFEEWVDTHETPAPIEYRARHADGSWRWMEARGNNQLDNPLIEGYVVSSRDITGRKEREQTVRELKSQYETLAEHFPDGAVYLIDANLECIRARGQELSRAGLAPGDIEGTEPHEPFPEEIADELRHYFLEAFDGNANTFEQEYGGERYRVQTVPIRCESEEITHIMAVSRNITEYAESRRELERQNERLEEFASIVSHDLRNPLGVAEGRLELAQDTCESEHIGKASDAIERSQTLIEDLLTLARGGDDVDETDRVRLADVAEGCWNTVETAAATLTVDTSRTIEADRARLQQLFENLYRNAVEHGGDDVTVTVGAVDGGFYVADTGPGIPASDREDVFEVGYSTNRGGTGFGLRIVKQVAEAHGWESTVTESEQGGARFEFTGVEHPDGGSTKQTQGESQ